MNIIVTVQRNQWTHRWHIVISYKHSMNGLYFPWTHQYITHYCACGVSGSANLTTPSRLWCVKKYVNPKKNMQRNFINFWCFKHLYKIMMKNIAFWYKLKLLLIIFQLIYFVRGNCWQINICPFLCIQKQVFDYF